MAKPKKHIWKADKSIDGVSFCTRCGMTKIKIKGGKTIMYRKGGIIDNSPTKNNCFILSKV